jgi:hypothetical protein
MTLKSVTSLAVFGVALGFGLPLMAQTAPPQQKPAVSTPAPKPQNPVNGQIVMQEEGTILAKDLIGQSVYEPDNKTKIGSIGDLVLSKDGKTVNGFVIGVGGFLGIGEKSVALQMDRLQIGAEGESGLRLTMDVKKEELADAPAFKSRKEQASEKQAAEQARNRPQQGLPTRPGQKPAN